MSLADNSVKNVDQLEQEQLVRRQERLDTLAKRKALLDKLGLTEEEAKLLLA